MGWRMFRHRVGDAYGADRFHMHVQLVGLIWPMGLGGGHVIEHGGYSEIGRSQRDRKINCYEFNSIHGVKPVKGGRNAQSIPAQIQHHCISLRPRGTASKTTR